MPKSQRPKMSALLKTEPSPSLPSCESNRSICIEPIQASFSNREKRLGFAHPQTLEAAMEFADVCRDCGLIDEAEQLYRRVLDVRQAARPDDPETLVCKLCLANVVRRQALGKKKTGPELWAESEDLYRQTIEAYHRLLGPADRATATAVYSLTRGLVSREDFDSAENELRLLLSQQEAALGPTSLEVFWTNHVLGWTLWKKKDYAAAAILYQRAYDGRKSLLGDSNDLTKASRSQLMVSFR